MRNNTAITPLLRVFEDLLLLFYYLPLLCKLQPAKAMHREKNLAKYAMSIIII